MRNKVNELFCITNFFVQNFYKFLHKPNVMNTTLLQKLVDENPLTKSEIAERAGVSRTTLENALAGADIKTSTIENLAKVLGVKVSLLYDEPTSDEWFEQKDERRTEYEVIRSDIPAHLKNRSRNIKIQYETLLEKVINLEKLFGEREQLVHEEKVSYLETILAEKERLIQVLMEQIKKE